MPKMIKCPTCQTQIEVPPAPAGGAPQIIKCPTCGKNLKIVAKKPAGATGAASLGGSIAGGTMTGTMAGQSVAAMSFHGEPPPQDDLPNLDPVCEVCKRPTDPEELVEDNGKLLCRDCIKGARSRVERPDVAPGMIDFKRPVSSNVRRSKLLNITPSFIAGAIAAVVLLACQIYLTLYEMPQGRGRAVASVVPATKPATPTALLPENAPAPATTEKSTEPPAVAASQPSPGTAVAVNPQPAPAPGTIPPAPAATTEPAANSIFTTNPTEPVVPAPSTSAPPDSVPPNTAVAVSPNPLPPVLHANDPLTQGIEKLQKKNYVAAKAQLEGVRRTFANKMGEKLTPEQQMTLVGLAAANIGAGTPQLAKAQLDIVMARGEKTRSAILNDVIMVMTKKTSSPKELNDTVEMAKQYLSAHPGDEYAADIYGTLIDRVAAMPGVKPEAIQPLLSQLDQYVDQLGRDQHPDQLKWGVEWKDKALVQQYRASRGHGANVTPPADLQRELEAAQAKVYQMQQALDQAKANHGDVFGAQNQLDAATSTFGKLSLQMKQAAGPAPKAKWLEKIEPIVPEGSTTTQ